MEDRIELLKALQEAIQKQDIDSSQVLALATELAKKDPDKVRFFADAGIIRRLGYELVSRQETAVSELVKNAYDADARIVDLIFSNVDEPGGTLEIRDDGIGMTREDLVEGFMRLSSTSKVREPISPRYKRRRAGRKGIGRFAVQRLGQRLTIVTQTIAADHAFRIQINWDQFEAGMDLTAISSRVENIPKEQEEGTTLLIEDLRDGWTEAQMRRIWRYVSDLIQPFPLSRKKPTADVDPGFRAEIYRQVGDDLFSVADDDSQVYEYAVAEIDAEVDGNGRGKWSLSSRLFPDIDSPLEPIGLEPEDPSEPFEHLRDVRLKAYYYIYQAGLLPRNMDRVIRDMSARGGGIRVYRNGFRVLPYGEERDDWLELDKTYGRRKILVPIANQNFFGFVEITDPHGERFEETASREGLIENDAYRELRGFVFRVLRAAVFRVAETRETKRIAAGRGSQIEEPPEEKVQKAINELRQIASTTGKGDNLVDFEDTLDELAESVEKLNQKQSDLIDEIGMLRVLASLGIVIGEFTHEIRTTLTAATMNADTIAKEVAGPESAREAASKLAINIKKIDSYARYFDRAVRENAYRELQPRELGKAIIDFVDEMKPSAIRSGIDLQHNVRGFDIFSCPMHGSELDSILFNFYSNALKAIRRAKRQEGKILIQCGRFDDTVYIDFADNGDGVPEELRERIFNPFYTTATYGNADIDDDLQGSGLGLKIVRDVATGYGGNVSLADPPNDYVTCFRAELPAASEEELDIYNT